MSFDLQPGSIAWSLERIREHGPERDLWSLAAVRERFKVSDLLTGWLERNPGVGVDLIGRAQAAVLDLEAVASTGLDANGDAALRLSNNDRVKVLSKIGQTAAHELLAGVPEADKTEAEILFAALVGGKPFSPNLQDREQLVALSEVGRIAEAAGWSLSFNPAELTRRAGDADVLQMLGGADLHRFLGRASPLRTLRMAWSRTRREYAGATVLIEGPGGMGKSMLVSRFVADLLAGPKQDRPDAVFHIDFDRRELQDTRPALVMAELARQLRRWREIDDPGLLARLREVASLGGDVEITGNSRALEAAPASSGAVIIDALERQGGLPQIILFCDSAEQVFGFSDFAADAPLRVADELRAFGARVMTIYGARAFPEQWAAGLSPRTLRIGLTQFTLREGEAYLRAEGERLGVTLSARLARQVMKEVGRSPLALRMAAALLEKEGSQADPTQWATSLKDHPERVQAMLYDRILRRLRDADVRKIALPGLLVRRLTEEVIAQVLAPTCALDLAKRSPRELLAAARAEGQLFWRDPSDPDPSALWHRRDVRTLMLPDLDVAITAAVREQINRRAIDYYAEQPGDLARIEELYHQLRLDEPPSLLDERWIPAATSALRPALADFPLRAQAYLRNRAGAASVKLMGAPRRVPVGLEAPDGPDVPDYALLELRGIVERELQSGGDAMAVLRRHGVDRIDGPAGDLYAQTLIGRGDGEAKLLSAARDLRTAPSAIPREIVAGVFAATAGLLEGLGRLDEALLYWLEARARPVDSPNQGIDPAHVSARVGVLRVRRKQAVPPLAEREAELRSLALLAQTESRMIAGRGVLAREFVAEVAEVIPSARDGATEVQRLLLQVLDSGEAFASARLAPERLQELARQLGFSGARTAIELSDQAQKLVYGGGMEFQRLLDALRDDVDAMIRWAATPPSG